MLNLKLIPSCRGLLLSVLIGLAPLAEAFAWSSPTPTYVSPVGSPDAAMQSSYTPYTPTVSPVGASYAPSIATTTGNSPYSNSPSFAPALGVTNIQRDEWDEMGGKDDPNERPISPVGEAWALLFLAAGYALYVVVRRRKERRPSKSTDGL
ncbi:MAG: hypothetical protein ACI30J_06010 [Paludibacteraceae bacterium]